MVVFSKVLPLAVGVIMFGLGLSLTPADFSRVVRYPRAIVVGLGVQTVVLVPVAFGIAHVFDLPPSLAIGFMLLAASPGGAIANIFSHLADGDVALNITLTAINSAVALVWLPLVLNVALEHFLGAGLYVPAPTQKILEVATVIVFPVVLGMGLRRVAPAFVRRAEKPVRIASIALLATIVALSISQSNELLLTYLAAVGLACLTFNLISMGLGYAAPRAAGLAPAQATAISMEIGVHNAAIAIFIAIEVLGDVVASVPPALYGLIQIATASVVVAWLRHRNVRPSAAMHRPGD